MSGIPMSAEEFARRQKAAKQRDRDQKNQSAELLRGYRGGVKEDELKLKVMKEEERKKQRDAAKLLQGYRGGLKEEDLKLRAIKEEERQKQLAAEQLLHSYQKKNEPEAKKRPQRKDPDAPYPPVNTDHEDTSLQTITPGSVSAKLEQFSSPSRKTPTVGNNSASFTPEAVAAFPVPPEPAQKTEEDEGREVEPVAPEPTAIDSTQTMTNGNSSEKAGELVDTQQTGTAVPIEAPETQNEKLPEAVDKLRSQPPPLVVEEETPVLEEPATPTNFRFDLFFSFGIVTEVDNPQYASYMAAVGKIVQDSVAQHADIAYNPSQPPYVANEKWDDKFVDPSARSSAKRVLVTAGVPLMLSGGLPSQTAEQIVTSGLKAAIQSRQFLALVRQGL